ncbi:MAG: hypothetical protein J6J36_00920 [Clostridia bacterium]|nr:hypothetical protein [Clostridia bacterium]
MKKYDKKKVIFVGIIIACIIIILYIFSLKSGKKKNNNSVSNTNFIPQQNNSSEQNIYDNDFSESDDPFEIKYETKTIRNLENGKAKFVCTENFPKIEGLDDEVAKKIESHLSKLSNDVWKDINESTPDNEINELLKYRAENGNDSQIGFTLSYNVELRNKRIITFVYNLKGGLGGAAWDKSSGVSFNRETGEVINVRDVVISSEDYIKACKNYIFEKLKKNESSLPLKSGAQSIINKELESMSGYFTSNGIMCIEIPLYEIIDGNVNGEFKCEVPYSLIKNYVYSNYVSLS